MPLYLLRNLTTIVGVIKKLLVVMPPRDMVFSFIGKDMPRLFTVERFPPADMKLDSDDQLPKEVSTL